MSKKTLWWIHIILTFGLWIVLIYTALNIKISYDESLSYYILKTNDWHKLIGMANTHWLNSLWMRIAMFISGDNLFAMRILSLAAFPLYATGVFYIAQTFKNRELALIAYALILLNPYALQFFTLARGYGLVMAIQAWLIYRLILILNKKTREEEGNKLAELTQLFFSYVFSNSTRIAKLRKEKLREHMEKRAIQTASLFSSSSPNAPNDWYIICHLCLLMMLANFSYLYTLFGVFAIFLLHIILRKEGYGWNTATLKVTSYFTLIIAGTAVNLIIYKYAGDLWFGGEHFVESVFGSVWVRHVYHLSTDVLPQVLSYLTIGIIAITTAYFAVDFFRKKEINTGVGLSIIVLTILGLNIFFKLTFGSLYIFKRTALMWWTPAITLFFIWLKQITHQSSDIFKKSDESAAQLAFSTPQPPPKGEKELGAFPPKEKKNLETFPERETRLFVPLWRGVGGGTAFLSITISILILANFIFQYKNNYHTRIEKQRFDEVIYSDLVELNPSKVGMGRHFSIQLQNYYQFKNPQFATLNYALIREPKLADCGNETAWNDLTQFDYIIASESETVDCLNKKNISFKLVKSYGRHQLIHFK